MAKKKTSKLTQRVHELEDAVTRLFTGKGPTPAKSKKSKRKSAASKTKVAIKKTARKLLKKSAKKSKRKTKA